MTVRFATGALALGTLLLPAAALAGTWAGLAPDNRLVVIDGDKGQAVRTVTIQPVQGSVVGIDVRPKDGRLYALTSVGDLYTVDPMTGAAVMASQLDKPLSLGRRPAVDFNPVADRLRVLGEGGASYRINVDNGQVTVDGSLKYDAGDMHAGKAPMVTAAAYSNSMAGAKETALYDIDTALGALALQAPPNDGILKSRGMLGVKAPGAAFDILADGSGGNTGYLVAGRTLYTVDLASGKASRKAELRGLSADLMDIAALPQ